MVDQYDPQLNITRHDALLDGPRSHVMNTELPFPDSWRPFVAAVCLLGIFAVVVWVWWGDHREGRPCFTLT
ncbi:hypothetical protein [Acaryochloris thomasi]|uniref:hypothetical protein n=1 Tax=Acaryochloris thomasi TaxID=2929456 RepID=UPI000DA6B0D4|nr:hypothetical protein [Acaryochloris thomasi]